MAPLRLEAAAQRSRSGTYGRRRTSSAHADVPESVIARTNLVDRRTAADDRPVAAVQGLCLAPPRSADDFEGVDVRSVTHDEGHSPARWRSVLASADMGLLDRAS